MFGVSFLSPLFLIGAIAAAVPILLHLFHRKTEVVIDFPAVRLLTRAPAQQHRRRRLRELLLLALRVTALVLLAISFARPYLAGAAAPESAPVTVIVVDTSMSLSAPNQFDRAKEAALRAVDAAPASHAIALVSFADSAAVPVEPTTDRSAARAAIAGLAPGPGGTRYRTALSRASEVIGARDARVVMITDLQQAGWDANDDGGLPDGVDVQVVAVARPAGNLAVMSTLNEQIKQLEVAVKARTKAHETLPPPKTVAGIGETLALTIALETGGIERFAKVGNFASYCRAVDSRRLSNGKKKGQGNVKNGNKYLAWAFVEAAHFAQRYCPEAKRFYERKKSRTNAIVASKALAHKLARACYHMLKEKKPFDVKRCFA